MKLLNELFLKLEADIELFFKFTLCATFQGFVLIFSTSKDSNMFVYKSFDKKINEECIFFSHSFSRASNAFHVLMKSGFSSSYTTVV